MVCSKQAYDSRAEALGVVEAIGARSNRGQRRKGKSDRGHAPKTVYKCQTCEKWHISSNSKKRLK